MPHIRFDHIPTKTLLWTVCYQILIENVIRSQKDEKTSLKLQCPNSSDPVVQPQVIFLKFSICYTSFSFNKALGEYFRVAECI